MFEKYETAYRYMYKDQLVAAEDDYLEEFRPAYDPDDIDWTSPTCKASLCCLLSELYQDRTDLAELIERAGLDEDDLADIGFSMY